MSIVTGKCVYGGMFKDKYMLEVDGEPFTVSREEYDSYVKGDKYAGNKQGASKRNGQLRSRA